MSEGLNDGQADVVEPLFSIAHVAGGDWPQLARKSVGALAGAVQDDADPGERLLAALKKMFHPAQGRRVLLPRRRLSVSPSRRSSNHSTRIRWPAGARRTRGSP